MVGGCLACGPHCPGLSPGWARSWALAFAFGAHARHSCASGRGLAKCVQFAGSAWPFRGRGSLRLCASWLECSRSHTGLVSAWPSLCTCLVFLSSSVKSHCCGIPPLLCPQAGLLDPCPFPFPSSGLRSLISALPREEGAALRNSTVSLRPLFSKPPF